MRTEFEGGPLDGEVREWPELRPGAALPLLQKGDDVIQLPVYKRKEEVVRDPFRQIMVYDGMD